MGSGFLCSRLAPTISPSLIDIAWAAGFYEGEGHARQTNHFCTQITLTQKDKTPLEKLRNLFGGSICFRKDNFYVWKLSGSRARGFLMTIYKFLSPRRKQQTKKALH